MASDDEPPSADEITSATLKRLFAPAIALIATVLVALFIGKSDGNSALSTLIYLGLAALGTLLFTTSLIDLATRRKVHRHRFAWVFSQHRLYVLGIIAGPVLGIIALAGIDQDSSDFQQGPTIGSRRLLPEAGPAPGGDIAVLDSDKVALRNLLFASNATMTRMLVTVINKQGSPLVLDRLKFAIHFNGPGTCFSLQTVYTLADVLTLRDGQIVDGQFTITDGPLDGYQLPVTGELYMNSCFAYEYIRVEVPVSVSLNPLETTTLALDIPHDLNVREISESGFDATPVATPTAVSVPIHLSFKRPDSEIISVSLQISYGDSDASACIEQFFSAQFHDRTTSSQYDFDSPYSYCR